MGAGFQFCFSSSLGISGHLALLCGFCEALQLLHVVPVPQNHFVPETGIPAVAWRITWR